MAKLEIVEIKPHSGWWMIKPEGLIWNDETQEWEIREVEKKETDSETAQLKLPTAETECICFAGKSRYCPVDHD